MKRTFRLLGLSALVLGLAVACNNNQPVEAVVDSVDSVIDEAIEDVTIDSALVAEAEQEADAPVVEKKKTTTTKKATSKTEVTDPAPVKEEPKIEANAEVKVETGLDKKSTKAKAKLKK